MSSTVSSDCTNHFLFVRGCCRFQETQKFLSAHCLQDAHNAHVAVAVAEQEQERDCAEQSKTNRVQNRKQEVNRETEF